MLALHGWLVGFKGNFEFENIGDLYLDKEVPYVALRSLSAVIGSITCCLVYAIMKESGYPAVASLFSASLIVFDNAHVVHTRLILLDAPLIFFLACSLFSYIKFYKHRHVEFSKAWWKWLCLTGVSLSLTLSCKLIGLFTFFSIGMAVALDLWEMLDIRKGHSLDHVGRHVLARVSALIVLPLAIYVFWFWIHFKVLIYSGTGDEFMSSAFQETLIGSPLTIASEEIRYNDTLVFQHRATKCFLHSHPERYPLKYPDGRISSQGQQVTCYPHNDSNNHWIVEPTKPVPSSGRGQIVRHNDIIRLRHANTGTYLFTHDVASPTMATNQEFTTWPDVPESHDRYNETKFKVVIDDAHEGKQWKTKAGHFRLEHLETEVAMWTRNLPLLPDWGFGQQEVNGQRNLLDKTLLWIADEIIRDNTTAHALRPPPPPPKYLRKRSFLKKFFELQFAMLHYNSGLTEAHPYASGPINWPFLLNGVSFWTGDPEEGKQVYMIGNVVGWWCCVMLLSIILGVFGADQFARRRGIAPIPFPVRNRLYKNGGFFILAWAFHYFPFFLMGRQTFLHHYLPAHLCSTLVSGMVFNFILTEKVNHPISVFGPRTRRRLRTISDIHPFVSSVIITIFIVVLIACFKFLSPLSYGTPGLNPEQVNRRRILSTWTLHFAK
ncbi:family 39 glycosyltransferase [Phakopsora pachyrhizi]|uniref:Dolichyl-phosphate-mannose--protein mannosyltransferase n=1 Tax=Phakopsora pachyrhizi TaxID=170000 RepID=A0AAV0AX62_PHAPC|nr:family 39 glycosyltransferase [Phakopsora pachyrhizi]